jgi:hypothetical protein
MLLGIALGAQTNASASTILNLHALGGLEQYQQTINSPCVIGDPSCSTQNKLPAGWPDATIFPANDDTFDGFSPVYQVSQIRAVVGDTFFVGLDINQNGDAQTLNLFEMLINGTVVSTFTGPALVPPTEGGGNGNGYADYTLTGFSLAALSATDQVKFHAVMSGLNDGREQFFLISDGGGGGGGSVTPEPGTLAMLGVASLALGIRGFRRVRKLDASSRNGV